MKEFSREHEAELRKTAPRLPIRLADEQDELGILDMFKMMHAEQPYHPLNLGKVAAMVRLAIRPGSERRGLLGIIGDRHDLKAGIFMLIDPIWYSDDWQLLEFFNFVRPEYRRLGFAQDLIAYAKRCSDQIGLDLTVGVFSNIRTEAKIRLYRRWLPPMGAFFCYAPPNRKPFVDRIADPQPANRVAAE
jgi:GNAT superfamily N-acetyltransferase